MNQKEDFTPKDEEQWKTYGFLRGFCKDLDDVYVRGMKGVHLARIAATGVLRDDLVSVDKVKGGRNILKSKWDKGKLKVM